MKRKMLYKQLLTLLVLLLSARGKMEAQNVWVGPPDIGVNWYSSSPAADTRAGGTVSLVNGPGTAPMGCGSLQMTTTDVFGSSQAKAQLTNYSYVGTPISAINALSYYAYRSSASTNSLAQTIGLNIGVDVDGPGPLGFTTLVFEPVYQPGGVGAMLLNTWQYWDAFIGGNAIWWSTKPIPGVCAFSCYVTWNTILANNPAAVISSSVAFSIGSGWVGQYTGAADALTIGLPGNVKTYNFEQVVNNVANTNTGRTYCSIQSAINDPLTLNGHTITVSSGTYNEQVLVNKGVKILGVGLTKPVVNYTGVVSGKPTLFDVSVPDVTIENMQLDVDLVKLSSGIIASGVNISNLTIKNNTINAVASSLAASFGGYGNRNAVSVNYAGYRIAAGGVNNVRYEGNTVTGFVQPNMPSPIVRYFRSGISLDEGGGNFTGNTSQAISHDVLVRFGSNGPVTVTNNICNGGGIELDDMNAGAGALSVTGNTFNAAFANVAAPGTAVLRLKNNYNSKVTNVSGNSFFDIEWGISMENYNSVTVSNNSFTPKAGSTTYHHVGVNTKSISTNSSTIVQVTIAANILNNIFNGSGVAGGAGVTFFNHDNDAASFGTFNVNENSFDVSIARAIEQDGQSGNSLGSTFPNYVGLLGSGAGSQTMMAPWTAAINGTCNWYGTTNNGTIATKVGAHVTYIPYLSDGTDNSGAIGFQPVPGSCNGSNVLTITCPANINVQCSSQVPPANVGSVTTSGTCPGVVVTHMGDVISNQTCANRYTITRTYQATDACSNTATCTQTITVNDITPPTITCPPNKTVSPTTLAGTVVTYTTPVVSDNCSGVGVPVRTAGPASGSTFPIGTTTVTYQVTDACGNTASCSFTVTVIDPYCDDQKKKAYVCHNGNTICVSVNAVPSHLNHGDYLGQCSTSLRSIVIEEPVTDGFRVNVSPNPSAGDFRIQVISKSMEPISVKVMDLSGKVLTVNSNVIKGSIVLGNELRPGTYIAEVIQGTSRQVIKLVKVN